MPPSQYYERKRENNYAELKWMANSNQSSSEIWHCETYLLIVFLVDNLGQSIPCHIKSIKAGHTRNQLLTSDSAGEIIIKLNLSLSLVYGSKGLHLEKFVASLLSVLRAFLFAVVIIRWTT